MAMTVVVLLVLSMESSRAGRMAGWWGEMKVATMALQKVLKTAASKDKY